MYYITFFSMIQLFFHFKTTLLVHTANFPTFSLTVFYHFPHKKGGSWFLLAM